MSLVGHREQVAAFKAAFDGGRPHHAWLLVGPRGLGKATFALEAATWLLAGRPPGSAFEGAVDSSAAHLIAAGSHLDFRRLERTEDDKGKLRSVIRIDEVRALQPVFRQTPALGEWRVVIVDSADELNLNAANALLKALEEPPPQTLFFLVSHSPGRLLPTIRSRCRRLRFAALDNIDMAALVHAERPDASPRDCDAAIIAAQGIPGRALAAIDSGANKLGDELAALAMTPPEAAAPKALALAKRMAGKAGADQFPVLLDLAPRIIAAVARDRRGAALGKALSLWEEAQGLGGSAIPLALDPQATAFRLGMLVAGLANPSGS